MEPVSESQGVVELDVVDRHVLPASSGRVGIVSFVPIPTDATLAAALVSLVEVVRIALRYGIQEIRVLRIRYFVLADSVDPVDRSETALGLKVTGVSWVSYSHPLDVACEADGGNDQEDQQ